MTEHRLSLMMTLASLISMTTAAAAQTVVVPVTTAQPVAQPAPGVVVPIQTVNPGPSGTPVAAPLPTGGTTVQIVTPSPATVPPLAPAPVSSSNLQERVQQLEQEVERLKQRPTAPTNSVQVVIPPEPEVTGTERAPGLGVSVMPWFVRTRTTDLMDYAIADPGTALATSGTVQRLQYDNATALRLGLDYQFANSGLDLAATHTFFDTSGSESATAPANGFLFSTQSHPFQNDSAATANAQAALDYKSTDLEVGYRFQMSQRFDVRLFGGLRFSDVDQSMTANYDGRDYTNGQVVRSNEFNGVGPRLGAEGRVNLGSGFSLFGRSAGSLLVGDRTSRLTETDNNGADLIADLNTIQTGQTVPVLELALGLNWDTQLGQRSRLNLSAGYEYQQLFNVGNSTRFVDAAAPGIFTQSTSNLSFQGFFIRGGLSFQF